MDKIAVAQTTSSGNWRENIEKAKQYIKKATEEEAVMIIFPEYFMNYYPDAEHNYTKKAQSLHGEFVQAMKMLAKEFKMWIIFGMNEQTVDETKNYNTMVILNDLGELVSDYKKTHLFNAYKWNESMNASAHSVQDLTFFIRYGIPVTWELRWSLLGKHCCPLFLFSPLLEGYFRRHAHGDSHQPSPLFALRRQVLLPVTAF